MLDTALHFIAISILLALINCCSKAAKMKKKKKKERDDLTDFYNAFGSTK